MDAEKPEVTIYTDGGCSPNPGGPGGWGAVLLFKENHRKEISGSVASSTNNRMEITAALKALQQLKKSCKISLHTDSQYLCNAFKNGWLKKWQKNGWKTSAKADVLNKDLWEEILKAAQIHEITWVWVKGHSTNIENNRCDELATEARKNQN